MKVCVTGHRGYVGALLVPLLRRRGHRVLGVDSGLFDGCALPGAVPEGPDRDLRRDIRDLGADDLAGLDAVVHLAGLSNDPLGDLDPALTDEINGRAAAALAASARKAGVRRFVFASTCSVYGAGGEGTVDEETPPRPLTPYAAAKASAEAAMRALAGDGFSPVLLRFATAYGVSPMLRFDLVANNLVAHATATGRVLLKSTGRQWRPLIHVADMAEAIAVALEAPRDAVHGATVNVGDDDANLRIADLADAVAAAIPGACVELAPGAAPDRRSYRVSFARLGRVLPAFRPRWTVARGVADLHRAVVALGLPVADFEGARFNRLPHLLQLRAAGRVAADLRPRAVARPA
ncbi:SDR family oxidoreductase [Stella sp.]|uniref:SDR family oxidoreductase n=1 Tax=Stella sp. TaxID=2912054 RepID=UPI0035B0BFB3